MNERREKNIIYMPEKENAVTLRVRRVIQTPTTRAHSLRPVMLYQSPCICTPQGSGVAKSLLSVREKGVVGTGGMKCMPSVSRRMDEGASAEDVEVSND
jgi:hypothetical protein